MTELMDSGQAEAEDGSTLDVKNEDPANDGGTWYFVDQSIKERLGTGDGPSFSVASLFLNSAVTDLHTQDEPTENKSNGENQGAPLREPAPTFLQKKNKLFVLEDDPRVAGVGDFFRVGLDVSAQDLKKTRHDIKIIVQNKFKRLERNHEQFPDTRPDGKGRRKHGRRRFKKRRT